MTGIQFTEQEYLNYKKFREEHKDYLKVKTFLDSLRININEFRGDTPLHIAARKGDKDLVSLLLEKGIDVDSRGAGYKTPLHVAVEYGHKDIVAMLLEEKANPNAGCSGLYYVLDEAAKKGDKDIVMMLLNKGAIAERGGNFIPAYSFASQAGHYHVADLIKDFVSPPTYNLDPTLLLDVNFKDTTNGDTSLHIAVRKGDKDLVSLLLEKGMEVDSRGGHDYKTPLHLAVEYGHKDIVAILLEEKADPNAGCRGFYHVLDSAYKQKDKEIIEMLLSKGAMDSYSLRKLSLEGDIEHEQHQDSTDLSDSFNATSPDNLEPLGVVSSEIEL